MLDRRTQAAFVRRYEIGDDTRWAKAFRRWVRETIVPRVKGGNGGE